MPVQIVKSVLSPEPLTIWGDIKRRTEYTSIHGLFKIGRIDLCAHQQTTIGETWAEPGLL